MRKLKGSKKTDILSGGKHKDKILGLGGDDQLSGNAGNDKIGGGKGNDALYGGLGDDKLGGGAGNDLLDGGDGDDKMDGGDGDDRMIAGIGHDAFIGGNGIDTVSYALSTFAVGVFLQTGDGDNGAQFDTFSGIENIEGSAFNDKIEGDGANNHFLGLGGNDYLKGGAGDDILEGGEGNDQMEGGAGGDAFIGGSGFDLVNYSKEASAVNVYLWGAANTGAATGDTFSSIEWVIGSEFSDVIQGDGLANLIHGQGGADTISGMDGDDTMYGGDGADLLGGGEGNDHLYAADDTVNANDIFNGGGGTHDVVDYFGASVAVVADLTGGGLTAAGAASGDSFTGMEDIIGSYYGDTLRPGVNGYAFGDRGSDTIYDSTGTEYLRGGRDADTLSDIHFGEDGVRDGFILEAGLGADTIEGFNSGGAATDDQFRLPENMFGGLAHNAQGVLTAGQFINSATDHNANAAHAQLIYQGNTQQVWLDNDGTGGGGAVLVATLTGTHPSLVNADFLIVNL